VIRHRGTRTSRNLQALTGQGFCPVETVTKKRYQFGILLFLLLALILWAQPPAAFSEAAFPSPRGAVNDFADVVPPAYKTRMENLAREVLEKTGTSVVVAVLPTLGEEDLKDYTNGLYSAWGIGKKGQDKGVLILLAVKERKLRIETGYGVEGILPDGLTGEIMDKYMLPHLGRGEYGMGLYNGMFAVSSVIAKDAGVQLTGGGNGNLSSRRTAPAVKKSMSPLTVILLIAVVAVLLLTPQGRALLPWILFLLLSSSGRGGGGFGGFGGGGFGGFGGGSSGGGGADRGF
jgi:uncharacterized protein